MLERCSKLAVAVPIGVARLRHVNPDLSNTPTALSTGVVDKRELGVETRLSGVHKLGITLGTMNFLCTKEASDKVKCSAATVENK